MLLILLEKKLKSHPIKRTIMSKTYKYKKILIRRRYRILAAILILLSGGLVLLPKYQKNEGITPEAFLLNVMSTERYISTDQLANSLINKDPSIMLIDVRSAKEYNAFSLQDAVNIPLADILKPDKTPYLSQDGYKVIFYSDDNFYADQAWLIAKRLGYKNIFVLKGGLNTWFNTILNPQEPKTTDSKQEFLKYNTRKAAAMYFGVGGTVNSNAITPTKAPKKIILTKTKKKAVRGGC
jgi:rhodanese-related sulfurtransferase